MNEHTPENSGVSQPPEPAPAFAESRPVYDSRAFSPSGLSIAAFVLGILSFVGCGPCFGLPALVIGLIELKNIKENVSPGEGRAFALTGAILGGISVGLGVLIVGIYIAIIAIAILTGASEGFY
jgi:hypothetical protein